MFLSGGCVHTDSFVVAVVCFYFQFYEVDILLDSFMIGIVQDFILFIVHFLSK